MTIEETIKYLTMMGEGYPIGYSKNYDQALQLGIEALKAWKSSRDFSGIYHFPLLPGETEE